MNYEDSILKDIRSYVVGDLENGEFDNELVMHINSSISTLNQNGIGKFVIVKGEEEKWEDLMDITQVLENDSFQMVPLYIALSTQLLFDPPPPSNVEYHSNNARELLWRLKIAFEKDLEVNTNV